MKSNIILVVLVFMIGHITALKIANITESLNSSKVDPIYDKYEKGRQDFIDKNGNDPSQWKEIHSHAKIQLNVSDPRLKYRVLDIPRLDEPKFFQQAVMIWNAKNSDKDNMAALIHNHGGGGARGNIWSLPDNSFRQLMDEDLVMIYVDYRMAPKYKSPIGQEDCYQAIKYIYNHAKELGVDKQRISLSGESGGAFIAAGAMQMIINESFLDHNPIKALVLIQPMINDLLFTTPYKDLNQYEKLYREEFKFYYESLATDLRQQQKEQDSILFPGKMDNELVKRFPKTVLITSEFDCFHRDALDFKDKLQKAGKLAEFKSYPGVGHGFMHINELKQSKQYAKDLYATLKKTVIN